MTDKLFVVERSVNAYEDTGPLFCGMFTSKELALASIPSDHFDRQDYEHEWYELTEYTADKFYD